MDETLFESLDDLTEGVSVMAPWYDDDTLTINHARAVVVTGEHAHIHLPMLTHTPGDCLILYS